MRIAVHRERERVAPPADGGKPATRALDGLSSEASRQLSRPATILAEVLLETSQEAVSRP